MQYTSFYHKCFYSQNLDFFWRRTLFFNFLCIYFQMFFRQFVPNPPKSVTNVIFFQKKNCFFLGPNLGFFAKLREKITVFLRFKANFEQFSDIMWFELQIFQRFLPNL